MMKKIVVLITLFLCLNAQGQTYSSSFVVEEPQPVSAEFKDFLLSEMSSFLDEAEDFLKSRFSLLKFQQISIPWGITQEKYQRLKHFGTWITGITKPSCRNTRAVVLVRDAVSPRSITYSPDSCRVDRGQWYDPYSGDLMNDARETQIDHYVPLKNAFSSGASEWSAEKRCLYANYLPISFHLLAVKGSENSRKGDGGPERYLPPDTSYQCQYVAQWLYLKLVWDLRLNRDEVIAVKNLVQSRVCDAKLFEVSSVKVSADRKTIADMQNYCAK